MRSVLFVPGNRPEKVEKALGLEVDVVLLDLEDSVPPSQKAAARMMIVEALRRPRRRPCYVRVNSIDGCHWKADLDSILDGGPDGIVLPKVERADQIHAIASHMAKFEEHACQQRAPLDLIPIIETARGIAHVEEIAIAGAATCVRRLAFGGVDYTLDLDLQWSAEEHELAYARARLVHASRLAGIEPPIDTVVPELKDVERFRVSARNGRRMGFQGKLCIHPDQIAPCNEIFTPSVPEIDRALAVVEAFEKSEAEGFASIQLDGTLVDYPVLYRARRVLALAERLGLQRHSTQSTKGDLRD